MSGFWGGVASVLLGGVLAVLGSLVVNRRQAARAQRVEVFHQVAHLQGVVDHHLRAIAWQKIGVQVSRLPEDLLGLYRLAQAIGPSDERRARALTDLAEELLLEDPWRPANPTGLAVDTTTIDIERLDVLAGTQIRILGDVEHVLDSYDRWLARVISRRL